MNRRQGQGGKENAVNNKVCRRLRDWQKGFLYTEE